MNSTIYSKVNSDGYICAEISNVLDDLVAACFTYDVMLRQPWLKKNRLTNLCAVAARETAAYNTIKK